MELLITGGFGYIGHAVLKEARKRGHNITVFEKSTKDNISKAKKYKKLYDHVVYGDIRNLKDIASCMRNKQGVIHLAGLIPPKSEISEAETHDVNVKGLENIINSIIISKQDIKLIYVSSFCVSGYTQDTKPPIKIDNNYQSLNLYSKSIGQCEKLLDDSSVDWCVIRSAMVLGHVSDISMELLQQLFEIPINYRIETIIDIDVATALLNGIEMMLLQNELSHKKLFIGGGNNLGHQHIYSAFINELFMSHHLKPPANKYFKNEKMYGDWYDTSVSQQLLKYQNTSFNKYIYSIGGNKKIMGIIPAFLNYFLTLKLEKAYRKKLEKLEL